MAHIAAYKDRQLANRPGEQWEDIPGLDGAYQISNFGRVKSLRRWIQRATSGYWLSERILKCDIRIQRVSGNKRKILHLHAGIKYNGKVYSISIARLVYWLFVKKFDIESFEVRVSFKDSDNLNIETGNLVLTTPSKTITKAYQTNHRPRKSFNKKAKPVSQYDLTGKWLATYPSVTVAAKAIGIYSSTLVESLNKRNSYTGGYIWKYGCTQENLSHIPKAVSRLIESGKLYSTIVTQYNMLGEKVKEYLNLKTAATALNVQPNSIRRVIIGSSLTAGGYYWVLGKGPMKISVCHNQGRKQESKNKICRPVTQYHLDGNRVETYPSIAEASRITGLRPMNIFTALKKQGQSITGGSLWMYGKGPQIIEVPEKVKRKCYLREIYLQPVTQYDKQGNRIAVYPSVKEAAAKINIQLPRMINILTGKHISGKGYYWLLGQGEEKLDVDEFLKDEKSTKGFETSSKIGS